MLVRTLLLLAVASPASSLLAAPGAPIFRSVSKRRMLPRVAPATIRASLTSNAIVDKAPGLTVAATITHFANGLAARTALSPLLWAALLGMGASAIRPLPKPCKAGVSFAKARLA